MRIVTNFFTCFTAFVTISLPVHADSTPTPDQIQFFEQRIRPLLVQECYECHSATSKKIKGGLRLDSKAATLAGGDSGPSVKPGDPNASLLIIAIRHSDQDLTMPPKKKLPAEQIADLERWVKMGAPDPRTDDAPAKPTATIDWAKARQWWSLRPIASPVPPSVKSKRWPANDIDRFLLARVEKANLAPAQAADKRTLIRRATYDLIGLPPTPEEIQNFLNDKSKDAFAKVVDRLLESPRYGERWGRHWLDVVRYADTAGDNSDFPIPQMYRYRDWVIDAFNCDLPYDEFVREQIAGDLLPADEKQPHARLIATGYLANARRFGSRVDDYPQHLTIEDTIDNLGRAFLGLTINCARCHDHKFDPIPTTDYYGLYGIFHSTRYPWPGIELEQKQRDLVALVSESEAESGRKAHREKQSQLDAEVKRLEKELKDFKGEDVKKKDLEKSVEAAKKAAEKQKYTALPFEQAYAVADGKKIEDVFVQLKGDPEKPGVKVPRHFLTAISGTELPSDDKTSGRLQLANWIVARDNPLAARVMVNRIWSYHFGHGLVPTPNDFGKQGKPPTHPELVDFLARQFIDSGWSIKSMHRLIMSSRAYQQSGQRIPAAIERDPSNELLTAFPRQRLDAESIRDTILFISGSLDCTPAGSHPFPPQTEWKFTQHNPFKAVYDTKRRSVYLMTQRIQRHPYLAIFDGADPAASVGARTTSTTPLQALFFLNDSMVHDQSRAFAKRIQAADPKQRLNLAYESALGRLPEKQESETATEFFANFRQKFPDQSETDAWAAFARALFRVNEFVYID